MKIRSDFCFFHFLKNFIISFFFQNTLKMFVWVWPIILWTKKNTFGGGLLLQRTKCEKSIFWKKNISSNFSKKIFCPSDTEFCPDSKMVLLFEFCPKLADLRRIKVFTFENWGFPLFRSECPWTTLRGKNLSKNGTNDLYWSYNEGLWWNWAKKKFEISKYLIIQIQSVVW